jgi:acyl-CoA thioesterase-2
MIQPFLDALVLEEVGEGSYRAGHLRSSHGVVFGGQLMAQTIAAAALTVPDKQVKSLHTVFARGASPDAPLEILVELMHSGRAFASATVTTMQGARLCTRALVLLDTAEPDLIRHGLELPSVPSPGVPRNPEPWWEVAVVDDVDISDATAVGPAELSVWTRFPGAPDDPVVNQALLAFATDGFLIGTAMRPHPGIGQSMAHVSISTTVLTHTLTFHEAFAAGDWLLLAQESPYAGRGRSYGRGSVFSGDRLVASFVQENMIRDFPAEQRPAAGGASRY